MCSWVNNPESDPLDKFDNFTPQKKSKGIIFYNDRVAEIEASPGMLFPDRSPFGSLLPPFGSPGSPPPLARTVTRCSENPHTGDDSGTGDIESGVTLFFEEWGDEVGNEPLSTRAVSKSTRRAVHTTGALQKKRKLEVGEVDEEDRDQHGEAEVRAKVEAEVVFDAEVKAEVSPQAQRRKRSAVDSMAARKRPRLKSD